MDTNMHPAVAVYLRALRHDLASGDETENTHRPTLKTLVLLNGIEFQNPILLAFSFGFCNTMP
jgi:hypothetical protein